MPLIQADQTAIANVSGGLCNLHLDASFGLSAILNLVHFQNFHSAISNATCCDLVTLIPQSLNTILSEINGILANIDSIVPMTGLLHVPTNLIGVIKWIASFVQIFIGPFLVALLKKIAMLGGVIGEVTTLAGAIEHALSDLGGCAESFLPKVSLNVAPLNVTLPGGQTIGHNGFNLNIAGTQATT
jgi:hypothetical protein